MSNKKGCIFVVSAPAGTGKTTLVKMLEEELQNVKQSISYTTRPMRPGEAPDIDYFFISKRAFEEKILKGDFLEYAKVFDHYYGTSKFKTEELLREGNHVILVIDTQGAMKLKGVIDAIYIFISPPSVSCLKDRLKGRRSNSIKEIEKRLSWAQKEMNLQKKYDYRIINDDLDIAYKELRSIVLNEGGLNR